MNLKQILFFSLISIGCSSVSAQEAITVSGGNATGEGGTVSYSVGQLTGKTYSGTSGSVSVGVQQTYTFEEINSINDSESNAYDLLAYPNPTVDHVYLRINEESNKKLSYKLTDTEGSILVIRKLQSSEQEILMTDLNPGIYFLLILEDQKAIKTFKIIKQ